MEMVADNDPFGRFSSHLITSGHSESTAKAYVANLRIWERWCRAHETDFLEAEQLAVQAYLEEQLGRLARNTVALRLSGLHAFYVSIGRREVTDGLRIKREKIAPRKPFQESELDVLLDACRNERDRAMITVGMECGLRVSEVVGLRKNDINLLDGTLLVRGKGAKQRWVILSPRARNALTPFVVGSTGVIWFTKDGNAMKVQRAKRNMWEIEQRAGIHAHWHRLRTTFASRFLQKLHDLDSLQTLMGHEDANTTRRYAAYGAQERALEQMRRFSDPLL